MADPKCTNCSLRARYDNNPRAILGRLWRWHADWCPGWKAYMATLTREKRIKLANQYDLPRDKT